MKHLRGSLEVKQQKETENLSWLRCLFLGCRWGNYASKFILRRRLSVFSYVICYFADLWTTSVSGKRKWVSIPKKYAADTNVHLLFFVLRYHGRWIDSVWKYYLSLLNLNSTKKNLPFFVNMIHLPWYLKHVKTIKVTPFKYVN